VHRAVVFAIAQLSCTFTGTVCDVLMNVSRSEVKKLTDVMSRLFNDPHIKVLAVFIDTLSQFIAAQSAQLNDWLPVMLPRLLTKSGSEAVHSLHSKMMHVFDVIRSDCISFSSSLYVSDNVTE